MNGFLLDIGSVAVKSIVSVLVLFVLARIMGKKQIAQLTYFDYVVGISIGSVAAALSVEKSITLAEGVSSMVIWAAFPLVFSLLAAKSIQGRKILDGTPTILIQNGKIIEKNLRKVKFTVNDLLEELRIKDIFYVEDVEFALLETSGKMSVLKKAEKLPVTNSDLKLPCAQQGLRANIIIDGKFMPQNIALVNRSETWAAEELKKRGISRVEDVLLACCDAGGNLSVNLKDGCPKKPNAPH